MGIWNTLFGSKSVTETAVNGIYNGIDKAWYTDEEKATGFLALLKGYEPFKVAQRLLAFMLVGTFVIGILLSVIMVLASGFTEGPSAAQMLEAGKDASSMLSDALGIPAGLVTAFYFGGGAVEGVVDKLRTAKR